MSSRGTSPSSQSKSPSPALPSTAKDSDPDVGEEKPSSGGQSELNANTDDSQSPRDHGPVENVDGERDKSPSSSEPVVTEAASSSAIASSSAPFVQGDWQAVWSPQHNTYYFFNMRTNETTWTNPMTGPETAGTSQASARYDAAAAAAAQGIDPALAYLDPSLAAGPSNPAAFTYQAKFNSRTGAFTKPDGRDPEHVSEYERMKRMNSVFFDMDQWQEEVDNRYAEEEEAGKKRKKPTKKDLDVYKERKKQKKLAKTAWLRT